MTETRESAPSFHHLYAFCPSGGAVGDRLLAAGLTEMPGHRHAGQGTANRIFPFRRGFLELIWVASPAGVTQPCTAPLKLHERSEGQRSPFGLAVGISNFKDTAQPPFPGWAYRPQYLSDDGFIWIAANDDRPNEPMLFTSPSFGAPPGRAHGPELEKVELLTFA